MKTSPLFLAALEAVRFDCVARYVAAGWDLAVAGDFLACYVRINSVSQ